MDHLTPRGEQRLQQARAIDPAENLAEAAHRLKGIFDEMESARKVLANCEADYAEAFSAYTSAHKELSGYVSQSSYAEATETASRTTNGGRIAGLGEAGL